MQSNTLEKRTHLAYSRASRGQFPLELVGIKRHVIPSFRKTGYAPSAVETGRNYGLGPLPPWKRGCLAKEQKLLRRWSFQSKFVVFLVNIKSLETAQDAQIKDCKTWLSFVILIWYYNLQLRATGCESNFVAWGWAQYLCKGLS